MARSSKTERPQPAGRPGPAASATAGARASALGRGLRALPAALAVIVVLAYAPLWRADYVQDDHLAIEENPIVAQGDLGTILSTSYWAGAKGDDRSLYRPLTILSYAWEYALRGGPDPRLAHSVNMLLHLLCSVLLLLWMRRLGASPLASATASLLFAAHPIHVEAVGNVVGRAEILAALFVLAALFCATWAGAGGQGARARMSRTGGDAGSWRLAGAELPSVRGPWQERAAAWATAVCVLLALGSKEVAIVAAPLLVLQDLLYRRPAAGWGRAGVVDRAAALAPTALAVLGYLALRTRALEAFPAIQTVSPTDNPLLILPEPQRTATALGLAVRSLRLLLWPTGLSADYSGAVIQAEPGLLAWRSWMGGLTLLAAVALVLLPFVMPFFGRGSRSDTAQGSSERSGGSGRGSTRRATTGPWLRIASLGAALFVSSYFIISNLYVHVGAIFAERFLYLPSAGFCVVVGCVLGALTERMDRAAGSPAALTWSSPRVRAIAAVVLACTLGLAVASHTRARQWRNDASVFAAAALVNPASPRAQFILGKLELKEHHDQEAMAHFRRTSELWPDYLMAPFERGTLLGQAGRFREAEAEFRETIRLSPVYGSAHFNLGLVLRRQGRVAEAERALRKAVVYDPALHRAWAELGHMWLEAGRYADAEGAYARAIALGRRDLEPLRARARGARSGAPSEAR